ncbi:MAG: hypothetical protein ACE5J9_11605 [Methanosarcinales archaeon]
MESVDLDLEKCLKITKKLANKIKNLYTTKWPYCNKKAEGQRWYFRKRGIYWNKNRLNHPLQ